MIYHDADMFLPIEAEVEKDSEVMHCVGCVNPVFESSGGVCQPDVARAVMVYMGVLEENYFSLSGSMERPARWSQHHQSWYVRRRRAVT